MSHAVRGLLLLIVFLGVLAFVSSTGRGGPVMAGLFAFAGIPLFLIALRAMSGREN